MRTRGWTGRLGGQHRKGLPEERTFKLEGETESTSFLCGRVFVTEETACAKAQRHEASCVKGEIFRTLGCFPPLSKVFSLSIRPDAHKVKMCSHVAAAYVSPIFLGGGSWSSVLVGKMVLCKQWLLFAIFFRGAGQHKQLKAEASLWSASEPGLICMDSN